MVTGFCDHDSCSNRSLVFSSLPDLAVLLPVGFFLSQKVRGGVAQARAA